MPGGEEHGKVPAGENPMHGLMRKGWRRQSGAASEAPPDERGGNG
jgi:hypothetical protein